MKLKIASEGVAPADPDPAPTGMRLAGKLGLKAKQSRRRAGGGRATGMRAAGEGLFSTIASHSI